MKTLTRRRRESVEYIEVTLDDIALANRLAREVLGRSLDELPPQTRRLLVLLDDLVTAVCEKQGVAREDLRFSRRDVRTATGWSDTQLAIHLERLVELEYVLVHRGGRGQSFVYELLYAGEGKDGSRFLPGLIDVEKLAEGTTTESFRGEAGEIPGSFRPHSGALPGGFRREEIEPDPAPHAHLNGFPHEEAETPLLGAPGGIPSYRPPEPKLLLRRVAGRL